MSDEEKSGAIRFPDFEQVVLKFEPVYSIQCTGLVANREFFLADRKFAEAHPEIIDDLTKAVDEASIWAKARPRAVAELLSHEVGIDVDTLQRITEHLPWGFQSITPAVIADQQKIADAFFALNLIPKKLDVREATLPAFLSSK
jgi:sulfonate transport system substrate-binding protein